MRRVAILAVIILITLAVFPVPAPGAHKSRAALARQVELREAAAAEARAAAAVGPTAEERLIAARLIAARTGYFSDLYGRRVGRWFVLVHAHWPRREWGRAMYCIRRESGGDEDALGAAGEIGLFQLLNYPCRPWLPDTNVRLAAQRWREDGWRPWTTMRRYW